MNTEPPPPTPDPFEEIAKQLATLAAGMVQLAGQIAALKNAGNPPPPPPQEEPAPEPEAEEQPEEQPEEQDKASDDQPTHEDGQGGEKDEPQDEPEAPENDEPTDSEAEGPKDEAEHGDEGDQDTEDTEDTEQPESEDLQKSDQDGEGEELDEQPDAPAEEQPAEPTDSDEKGEESAAEGGESAEGGENEPQEGDGEQEGEGDESEGTGEADAPEGQETGENEGGEGEKTDAKAERDDDTDEGEPEHVDYSDDMTEHGDGESDPDAEDGKQAENDGRGTAAALPPDLPPMDSTLANCSPPPAPESIPYRPLSPIAKKCADVLTGALGKRFAMQRADRHTGTLSANAVARHAPDVFRRRPRHDGRRPKLTVIADTSGSMSRVHEKHGQHLIDGLLEAHRRRVIDLRLYDSYIAGHGGRMLAYAKQRGVDANTGQFLESEAKKMKGAYRTELDKNGALSGAFANEMFATVLESHKAVILDSDATIIFTDGHWTDGALDKVRYQLAGMQIVGLYISNEIEEINTILADARDAVASIANPADRSAAEALFARLETTAQQAQFATNASCAACSAYEQANKSGSADERQLEAAVKEASFAYSAASDALYESVEQFRKSAVALDSGRTLKFSHTQKLASRINQRALSSAMLELNSHRAYCTGNAVEAAQVIVQEITRQLESK